MSKITSRYISLFIALVLTLGSYSQSLAAGTIYYVSATGNDTNPGTSTAPFKTFSKAVSVLQAGDTLQVINGIYHETLYLTKSGTTSAPIKVFGNGAILEMQGNKSKGISATGSNLLISGFEITGAMDFGIYITGRNVVIENNIVHDNVTKNGVGTCGISSSWGSGIKVKLGGENTTIRNNTVFNNCGEGIAITRGITAMIDKNTTWDNFSVNIYIDNSPFVTVQNNVSYCKGTHLRNGNRPTGIALGEENYSGWGAQLHDILVSGNTVTDCRTGIAAFESNMNGTLSNVAILNNFIPSGEKRSISIQTASNQNVLISNNLVFNSVYVFETEGITLANNTISNSLPTAISQVPPTNTIPPSPTPTKTIIPTQVSPTATLPTPSSTATLIPATPTYTTTSIQPTVTALETVFDDKDGRFTYSTGWQDMTQKAAYNGAFKMTTQNGAFVTFTFKGQSFSILYNSGKTYKEMKVYVDNVLVGTINQKQTNSAFQLRWNYPGLLSPGSHTLKLVFVTPNKTNKTNGSFDAVIVR